MRLFWLSLLLIPVFYISAQAIDPSSVTDRRAQLESELAGIEKEIGGYRNIIQDKQNQAQSLERDIALLDAQIKKSQLEIRARNIAISNLQGAIGEKNKTISALDNKIEREKDSLSELLRELTKLTSLRWLRCFWAMTIYPNFSFRPTLLMRYSDRFSSRSKKEGRTRARRKPRRLI